jgi:leader peptidase (prepilin peptidase)/N-methyltransferase
MNTGSVPLLAIAVPIACIAGLFVGSFLNVVVYRTPLGLSVATPRSFCPTCKRQLQWWENIPVVSWSVLRGRCRTCHQSISVRYPLVEAGTAAVFGLVTWAWHGSIYTAAYCALAASLIAVSLIEYGGKRSPLWVAATGTGVGEIIIIAGGVAHSDWRLLGGSLIGLAIALVAFALLRVTDPDCIDPRGYGRTGILIVGCWVGPLDAAAIVIGALAWIGTFFISTVLSWVLKRRSDARLSPGWQPIVDTPLVTAVAVAVAVALVVAG